jgi:hypothetical protein
VETKDEDLDRLETVLAATIDYVGKEHLVLAHLEQYFSPKPASLGSWKELQRRMDCLTKRLGGPPMLIVTRNDDPKPCYDLYPAAALHEITNMFHRTRRSVSRAHMSMIGSNMMRENPEILLLPSEGGVRAQFLEAVESAFLGASRNRLLRAFQKSEKEDGLKWLLRRRNLVVHSSSLRPIQEPKDRTLIDSEFNHLELALRQKLAPGTPVQEIERMHWQLQKAAELFPSVLELCEHAAVVRGHGREP